MTASGVHLDRLVHEPARLVILTILSECATSDFLFLQSVTGLTKGNLSGHLRELEQAHAIKIRKSFVGRKPRTTIELTELGGRLVKDHWEVLDALRRNAVAAARNRDGTSAGSDPFGT